MATAEVMMRRWHEERDLMLRRWRQEIANHERYAGDEGYPYCGLAPVPPQNDGDCHCYRGMGFMRKRTPYGGCGCIMCKYEKIMDRGKRSNKRREAIDFEMMAHGE